MKNPTTRKNHPTVKPVASDSAHATLATDILGRKSVPTTLSGRVPAKWRWHYEVLLGLEDRLSQASGDLRKAAGEPLAPHSPGAGDSATDEFDHTLALNLLSAEANALDEIREAFGRIRDGTYGVCQETGMRISAARLKAVPWTRFTREVKERHEQSPQGH